jgi:chromosomal replication initiation ATPase DnaA
MAVIELRRHYQDVRARLNAGPPVRVAPLPIVPVVKPVPQPVAAVVLVADDDAPVTIPKVRDIQRAVCEHFKVSFIDLISHRRDRQATFPRQIAMYLCKTLTLRSLPDIGDRFGGRDHTTILYAVRKITRLRMIYPELRETISTLTARVME